MKRIIPYILAAALVLGLIGANLWTWSTDYPPAPDSGPDPHHPDRYLTVWGTWDAEKLTEAPAGPEPVGYGLRLLGQDGPEIQAEIYNDGLDKVAYEDLPQLQVQLEGVWYRVPRAMSIDRGLPPQLDRGRTQAVTMTGSVLDTLFNRSRLPAGDYRLLWHGRYFDLSAVETQPEEYPPAWSGIFDPYHPARYLTAAGEWDKARLRGASTGSYDVDCTARVLTQTDRKLEVELSNGSNKPRKYDDRYSLEVLLGGVWYSVPFSGAFDFAGVEQSVAPGEKKIMAFDLRGLEGWNWSKLPAGDYRLRWLGQEFGLER